MPPNQPRRDAERLRLQRQLDERRERELARRRTTLIVSIVGTLVLLAGVLTVIAVFTGRTSPTQAAQPAPASSQPSTQSAPTSSAPTSSAPTSAAAPTPAPGVVAPKACRKPPTGNTAKLAAVTVTRAADIASAPQVRSRSTQTPKALLCRDLVVGKGKAATRTSTVKVQYSLIYYRNGQAIQSTWQMGQPATFSIAPGHVIPGFTDGIGGTGKVAPMHVGGRRVMILPPSLAYGASGNQGIAPNATLVFVVDLLKVSG